MSNEQRVRTMAGWVGVEISKSRVRTPGKAGYGLYRVRPVPRHEGMESWDEAHSWTEYLFELAAIEGAVLVAIVGATPAKPQDLMLYLLNPKQERGDRPVTIVPTRWTSAYRGPRNKGLAADLEELERTDPAVGAASVRLDETVREIAGRSTVRSRQRDANAEFQAEHLRRRAYGLQARYAAKTARNSVHPKRSED